MNAGSGPEPSLEDVRARHPGRDIMQVFGGYMAVPAGTEVIQAMFLSALEEKISAEEQDRRGGA